MNRTDAPALKMLAISLIVTAVVAIALVTNLWSLRADLAEHDQAAADAIVALNNRLAAVERAPYQIGALQRIPQSRSNGDSQEWNNVVILGPGSVYAARDAVISPPPEPANVTNFIVPGSPKTEATPWER